MVILLENLDLVKMLEGLLQALYVFFVHSSKKFQKTCWLNQYQGQQIALEHQNVLDLYPFSNKMHVCRISLINYQDAYWKFLEQGCFQEHAYSMWHWVHSWAPLYPSYAWMCPCNNQNCTKLIFYVWFCEVYEVGPTKSYWLYYDPFTKYEDLTFDDFQFSWHFN